MFIQNQAKETFLMEFNFMHQVKNISIITLIAFILIIYSFNLIHPSKAINFNILILMYFTRN